MKDLIKITIALQQKSINIFTALILYFRIKMTIKNFKKSMFNNDIVSKSSMISFIQLVKHTKLCTQDKFNIDLFKGWFRLLDDEEDIIFDINCSPVRINLFCGNTLSYRYELFIKNLQGNREIHVERDLELNGLDSKSPNIYEAEIYKIIKIYLDTSLNYIEDSWINFFKERIISNYGNNAKRFYRKFACKIRGKEKI